MQRVFRCRVARRKADERRYAQYLVECEKAYGELLFLRQRGWLMTFHCA